MSSNGLANAHNSISDCNDIMVGVLLFPENWTGLIWWCSAACDLVLKNLLSPLQPVEPHKTRKSVDEP
jgi:hypothetical protein